MAERTIGIALLGCGIVGSGVARILAEQRDLIARRTGLAFDVRHVVVRDLAKQRAGLGKLPISTDAVAAIDDPAVQIVVELIGGAGAAGGGNSAPPRGWGAGGPTRKNDGGG